MSRIRFALMSALFSTPILAAQHDSLPGKYWHYMDGYRYQYTDNCLVGWDVKSAVFVVPDSCPEFVGDRLNSDAIKSIEYAKSKSDAKNFYEHYSTTGHKPQQARQYSELDAIRDAKEIWRRACIDAKDLRSAYPNQLADNYPGIDRIHALRLIQNARQTVTGLGGMVNCAEQGHYAVEMYVSDIDIRANSQPYSVEQSGKDALVIWLFSCVDAKAGRPSRIDALLARFYKIKKAEVAKLHRNAYAAVDGVDRLAGGNINCEQAVNLFFPNPYLPDPDIRLKEYRD